MNAERQTEDSASLFENETCKITVTTRLLRYRAQTFPIKSISKVSDFKMPFEFGGMLVNGFFFLVGLGMIFTFSFWSLLGLGVGALCGWNLKNIFQKHYVVRIEFHSADDLTIHSNDLDFATGLRDALHEAISQN